MFGDNIEMIPHRLGNREDSKLITEKTKKLGWVCEHKLTDYINKFKRSIL